MERQAIDVKWCLGKIVVILLFMCLTYVCSSSIKISSEVVSNTLIKMPRIRVENPDTYMCMAVPVTDLEFSNLVGFKFEAIKGVVHHVSMAGCEDYKTEQRWWNCKNSHGHICSGRSITFGGWDGWSKHHVDTLFPDAESIRTSMSFFTRLGISRHFEKFEGKTYRLVLTKCSFPSLQKLFCLAHLNSKLKKNLNIYFIAEITCKWRGVPVNIYEYSAHTHDYGQLVEGYIVRNNTALLVTKEKPKGKSHDTTKVKGGTIEIRPGDILAVRCTYRNSGPNKIRFGLGGSDEMCNLSLRFEYDAKEIAAFPESVKCSADAQDKVWCPKNSSYQVGVLCDLQQAATNNIAPEDVHGIIM